jgi:hypothetical protein
MDKWIKENKISLLEKNETDRKYDNDYFFYED